MAGTATRLLVENAVAAKGILLGHVQGIGVRPAIAQLATKRGLAGTVCNVGSGVEIVIEGTVSDVDCFRKQLVESLPPHAVVRGCEWSPWAVQGLGEFRIVRRQVAGVLATPVPTDRAVCQKCLRETLDKGERRQGYAFTSCTQCGPRFSIVETMPYERTDTTMQAFAQCKECEGEYSDPGDRRFHAQTNACPKCGPLLWCSDHGGQLAIASDRVVEFAAVLIQSGGIVAIRGLGGYQLVCDATNRDAVNRLRTDKRRPDKPFAVVVANVAESARIATASPSEVDALASIENPIVILRQNDMSGLAPEVSSGLATVGTMLPTTPLHALLVRACGRPLVVTSGNVDGEPLATEPEIAEHDLANVADLFAHHDRPIAHPVDDSVIRVIAGRPVTIRLARGLVPLPLPLDTTLPGLAVGGHQKVTIALCNGSQSVLCPHLGDLDALAMRERFDSHVAEMLGLYACKPEFLVGDLHPDYFTGRWLRRCDGPQVVVGESGMSVHPRAPADVAPPRSGPSCERLLSEVRHVIRVQHHHAHIAAGMLENGWQDREVLGVAFDGTGYGPDGTIWGGEFLRCTLTSFRRVARLRPFRLPGGERAIREPWRIALSLLVEALPPSELTRTCKALLPTKVPWRWLLDHLSRGSRTGADGSILSDADSGLSPMTTSAGRLFDGIASLVLQIAASSYEGLPAIRLEDVCEESEPGQYEFTLQEADPIELDWRPVVRQVVEDVHNHVPTTQIAIRFHRGLAAAVALIAERFHQYPVVLGGGVFQNRFLVEQIADLIPAARLGLPGRIPPNDGGLAAGQLAIASRVLESIQRS